MTSLMDFRKLYKDEILKRSGIKLGFMSAFSRACILAMKDIPAVNASIEGPNGGDTIVYRDYVDISVAVATEKGLVTPVVRNSESLSLIGIEKAIADLGKKARDNKLTIEDMAGGTFTISNGGVFGSLMGTPIINLPQTAVLGLHAIKEKPVAVNGKVEIRPMMFLALTYDHRLLDGREAVMFLVKVCDDAVHGFGPPQHSLSTNTLLGQRIHRRPTKDVARLDYYNCKPVSYCLIFAVITFVIRCIAHTRIVRYIIHIQRSCCSVTDTTQYMNS